jgi:hypothetical protein
VVSPLAKGFVWVIAGFFFLIFFTIFTSFVVFAAMEGGVGFAILFGTVELATIAIVAFFLLRQRLARRKIGPVEFTVDPPRRRAGEKAAVGVRFQPRQFLRLNGIWVRLSGTEIAVSGTGTNRTTHRHIVHKETIALLEAGKSLFPGEPVELETLLELPEDAPPTFSFGDNQLRWTVDLKIGIPRWPDYTEDRTIRVVR